MTIFLRTNNRVSYRPSNKGDRIFAVSNRFCGMDKPKRAVHQSGQDGPDKDLSMLTPQHKTCLRQLGYENDQHKNRV